MRSYLYSIFSRYFLACSGFAVFLLTATLYGPEGRGAIAYGTSLFAITGIFFSANLGRSFIEKTILDKLKKRKILLSFLKLHIGLSFVALITGYFYWLMSDVAQTMLTFQELILFSLTTFFFSWSVSGNSFFAAFGLNSFQETIILISRSTLLLFLVVVFLNRGATLDFFIFGYSIVLFFGVVAEITTLYLLVKPETSQDSFSHSLTIINALVHHVDYLSINLFPLCLTLISAFFITKGEVGIVNFSIQILNMIFLLSTIAHIKITESISNYGLERTIDYSKKLFISTAIGSLVAIPTIYFLLNYSFEKNIFKDFQGAQSLFLIGSLSLPGYIIYQFLSPIWIKLEQHSRAAKLNLFCFLFFLLISPLVLFKYQKIGVIWLFSLFHCALLFVQIYLYWSYLRPVYKIARRN